MSDIYDLLNKLNGIYEGQLMKYVNEDLFDDECDEVKDVIEKIKQEYETGDYEEMNGENNEDPVNWFFDKMRYDYNDLSLFDIMVEKKMVEMFNKKIKDFN